LFYDIAFTFTPWKIEKFGFPNILLFIPYGANVLNNLILSYRKVFIGQFRKKKSEAERNKYDNPATRVSAFWLHQVCNSICMKGGSKTN